MKRDLVTLGVALAAALFACKKEPEPSGGERADSAIPATPAVEETASATDTEPTRATSPGTPPKRIEPAPGPGAAPPPPANGPESPAGAPSEKTASGPTPRLGPEATPTSSNPPPAGTPPVLPASPPPATRAPLPDLRLLLTAADIAGVAGDKVAFQRTVLPGVEPDEDRQSLYFEPVKGRAFGFAIQVFREGNGQAARQRWESAFATYPNAVEVAPVAGSSFFAYWGEVLHVGFLQPHGNLVVVVSCGRTYCDSDALYALAKKANSRIK